MGVRAEIQAQINRMSASISNANEQISILRNRLAGIQEARRELIKIQGWVDDDNRALRQVM